MTIIMFKSIHALVPTYFCYDITMLRDIAVRTTRYTVNINIRVAYDTLDCCKNVFAYRYPVFLNALPDNIRKCIIRLNHHQV